MAFVIVIVLGFVLAALWDTHGPSFILKAIGWTVGISASLVVLLCIIGLTRH
jgi:hypothetical protein